MKAIRILETRPKGVYKLLKSLLNFSTLFPHFKLLKIINEKLILVLIKYRSSEFSARANDDA